ncbi:MAG TPA: glycosyltransferase [Bacillota bacterium]|nr:glycosyltransferase [Bacillota bacterium]HOH88557.1 glycosyltransferase [Bacillota bacterium]
MKKSIILFGASKSGEAAMKKYTKEYKIAYFCDNDKSKWGTSFRGVEVVSPDNLKMLDFDKIIITSMYYDEISKQLSNMGIEKYEVFKLSAKERSNKSLREYITSMHCKIQYIYEVSRSAYWDEQQRKWKQKLDFNKMAEELSKQLRAAGLDKPVLYDVSIKNDILKERPKIIHAIPNTFVGGSTQLIVDLIEHLGHKYDMEIITAALPKEGMHKGMTIHDFSGAKSGEEVSEFLKSKNADLLHIHYWGDTWYEHIFDSLNTYDCKVVENINTPIAAYAHNKVDEYVYVSEYARRMFGDFPENSSVIHPGIDLSHFEPSKDNKRPYAVGMVYRLEQDKLREDSIKVFIELAKRKPELLIYIVGYGTFFNSYVRQVYKENVRENFVFAGYVPYKELPAIYDKFSIFVAPVWKESFGQVTPFAMNKEMVVTGFNIGALPEILDGEVTLGNSLEELVERTIYYLDNQEAYRAKGSELRRRAQDCFCVKAMVSKYEQIYDKLLSM